MKLLSFFMALLLCLGFLSSCTARGRSCDFILFELMAECSALPDGKIYRSGALSQSDDGFLSPYLAEALYGEKHNEYFDLLSEYAIYVSSFASPYEIGVFRCYSRSDGLKIENMCRQRADIVSVALRETEFFSLCQNIRVMRRGEYVVFILTDSPDAVSHRARELI